MKIVHGNGKERVGVGFPRGRTNKVKAKGADFLVFIKEGEMLGMFRVSWRNLGNLGSNGDVRGGPTRPTRPSGVPGAPPGADGAAPRARSPQPRAEGGWEEGGRAGGGWMDSRIKRYGDS